MNDDEMRIAIVGACPKLFEWHDFKDGHIELHWAEKSGRYGEVDLLNDLNAMHETEKVLNFEQKMAYASKLWDLFCIGDMGYDFFLLHCTAKQRAEAVCRTLFPERFK